MNSTGISSPGKWLERDQSKKFNLNQLDCLFTLQDVSGEANGHLEEEEIKGELLRTPLFNYADPRRTLAIDKLFKDEELYLGDASEACLDSTTLPMLFRKQGQRGQKRKEESRKPSFAYSNFHPANDFQYILSDHEKLLGLGAQICDTAGMAHDLEVTIPAVSPLGKFVSPGSLGDVKCHLSSLLAEVLRSTFQNIHDATYRMNELPMTLSEEKPSSPHKTISEEPEERSVIMSDIDAVTYSKKRHKQWTAEEEARLSELIGSSASIRQVSEDKWDVLAKKLDRTIASLHAKAKILIKNTAAKPRIQETLKEEGTTHYNLISAALNALSKRSGTKEEIMKEVRELRHSSSEVNEKGIVQCLSKRFEKTPGIYALKDGVAIPSKEKTVLGSIKDRLIYILGALVPSKKATLTQIRQLYQSEFASDLDMKTTAESNQAVWEKSISKTLLKCSEFDKTNVKSKYTFKKQSAL